MDFLGGLVQRYRNFWLDLGRLETTLLARRLPAVFIRMPIYVCGLARAGTTLLHEVVASHPDVATHRVKDYPLVFTPYWWRRASTRLRPQAPRERAHRDRIMIDTDSPDALEEMLWTAFFPRCHDPSTSGIVGAGDHHPAFESFYDAHVRKLLLAEGATRYVAKANYHVARLAYLVRLFPDARFLIPIRSPTRHVQSLLRQQRRFSNGQRRHRRALAYMQRSGHFEFGLDRRPMNLGDADQVRRIIEAWDAGDEVRGLAMQWDMVYGYLARLLDADDRVRAAAHVVRYETLCSAPADTLRAVFDHCQLPNAESIVQRYASNVSQPSYYASTLSRADHDVIRQQSEASARRWGY